MKIVLFIFLIYVMKYLDKFKINKLKKYYLPDFNKTYLSEKDITRLLLIILNRWGSYTQEEVFIGKVFNTKLFSSKFIRTYFSIPVCRLEVVDGELLVEVKTPDDFIRLRLHSYELIK